jgi:hypothetical protein
MKKIYIIIIFILIIAVAYISFVEFYVLEIRVNETEELVFQQKSNIDDYFSVYWIHSVTLQPVIETYKLEEPGKIPIVKMTFDEFGPNLPAHPEFNQYWVIEDGKYNVLGYERVFDRVPVTIGAVIADHRLIYNDSIIHLKDIYKPGGFIHIGLQRKCLFQFLKEEVGIWIRNRMKILI